MAKRHVNILHSVLYHVFAEVLPIYYGDAVDAAWSTTNLITAAVPAVAISSMLTALCLYLIGDS